MMIKNMKIQMDYLDHFRVYSMSIIALFLRANFNENIYIHEAILLPKRTFKRNSAIRNKQS